MLDLAGSLTVDGTTLFRDHADARTFYVLPDRLRLARDEQGRPELYLLRYHRAEEEVAAGKPAGGGLLMLRCELAVDEERRGQLLAGLRAQLAAGQGPPAKAVLTRPQFTGQEASWRVGDGEATAATPGPDLGLALSIGLTLEQADALWQAIAARAPAAPLTVGYRLRYQARDGHRVVEREHAVEGPLPLALDDAELDRALRDVDLDDAFFKTMTISVSTAGVDFARHGIRSIHVYLEYAQRDEHEPDRPLVHRVYDNLLDNEAASFRWQFYPARATAAGHRRDYRWRADVLLATGTRGTEWVLRTDPELRLGPAELGLDG